ncbi:MAG TPA: hypothetical protein VMS75_12885 [Terriglobales bacterium]|nr:hypothetical protein [Terriglobales bacterium]
MKAKLGRPPALVLAALALLLAAAGEAGAAAAGREFGLGLGVATFSRAVASGASAGLTKVRAATVFLSGTCRPAHWLLLELFAGLPSTNPDGLVFEGLPISIDYEAGAIRGLLLGGGLAAKLGAFGRLEIEGAGRFVYSQGATKTRPMSDFTVSGSAGAKPAWLEASLGPRLLYRASPGFVPYLRVAASWFRGSLTMTETLGDLAGREKLTLKAKAFLEAALGADVMLRARLTLRAEAGLLPRPGGADAAASAGLFYRF